MNYNEMKTVELRKIAQKLKIKGYASGNKAYLVPEIEKAIAEREAAKKAEKAKKQPQKAERKKGWTFEGKSIAEWSRELNIPQATLRARMKRGWELKDVFTAENHTAKNSNLIEYNGKAMTLNAWARELNVSPHTLFARINRLGWTIEDALSKAPNKKTHGYYMIHRPAGPGCQPKEGLVEIEDFGSRTYIEGIDREAWSLIKYDRKLTEKEIRDYELIPA